MTDASVQRKWFNHAALLAGCKAISPHIFERGLDPLPGDGPATRSRIEETKLRVTRILEAAANATAPDPVAVEAGLVERLNANAELQECWDKFELGMEAPAPLLHKDTAALEREAASALSSLQEQVETLTMEEYQAGQRIAEGVEIELAAAEAKVEALTMERLEYAEALSDAIIEKNDEITRLRQRVEEMEGATAKVSVKTMKKTDGAADYFVSIEVGDREVTPHVFIERYKADYHVALYDWLLNGKPEPDLMAYGPSARKEPNNV